MLKRLIIPTFLIMLSSGVQALTLGQIHVHSFIDQPLKATIDLQGVKAGELTAFKVKLASRNDFKNAGVDWNKQLEGLRFSIIHTNKGPAVRVTSRIAVVEPFLSFVVDAKWANGKMVKDFTLLLDPPLYSGKKAAAVDVADAVSVTASQPVQTDKPKLQPQPQKQAEKPSVSPAAPQEEAAVASPVSDKAGSATQTMTGASLWQVASKVRPADATMQQTMIAIHEENPDSFSRGNMNLLKKGQLLRIPSAEVIKAISGSAAINRVAKHEKALRAGKSVTSSKRLSPEIITLATEAAAAESTAQQATAVTPPSSTGRLRLDSAADDVDEGAVSGDPASGEADIATLKTTGGEETQALRSRVALLEEQLKVAHKLIRMKGELAQLQQLYRQIDAQRSKDDTDQMEISDEEFLLLADADAVVAAEEETVSAESDQETLSADDALAANGPQQQQISTLDDKSEAVESSQDDAGQSSPAAAGDVDTVASEETPAEKQTGSVPADTERVAGAGESEASGAPDAGARRDSLIEGIDDNLLFGAGGVAVLGLLLSFLMGRRRGKGDASPDFAYNAESQAGEVAQEKGGPVRGLSKVDETLAQQSQRESTMVFDPPETLSIEEPKAVDPLEFATLLIGNGAYRQAQEVLMQAVETDPARTDLHLQLMELFHKEKDRHAFEAEMNQLENSGVDIDPADWRKIETMHADLLPPGVDASRVVNQEPFEVEVLDLDDSSYDATDDSDADVAERVAEGESQPDSDTDSDLEEALRAFEMVLEDKKSEAGFALDETAPVEVNPVVSAMPGSEIVEDLELEDDLVIDDNAESSQGADVIMLDDSFGIDSHINDDFNDVFTKDADDGKEEIETLSPGEEEQLVAQSEELSITSFNTDPSTLKQAEAEAKIDLAAAFADMGDVDGARDILDEVIADGSAKQQRAAREMLKKYL